MKRLFFLCLIFLMALALPQTTQIQAQSNAEWTIMLYGAMDNDLEKYIFADLQELQIVGSTSDVNLIAQVDRTTGYETRGGDWTDTRRFYLEQTVLPNYTPEQKITLTAEYFAGQGVGTIEEITQELTLIANSDPALFERIFQANLIDVNFDLDPVEILGEADMGDPQTLADFVAWGITNYPANRYMLVISSHGSGWAGLGPDYDSGQSMLELSEIESGVRAALDATGVDKLDIIGFDACLMSQYEVATALESVADFSLAAEEVIPGQGWQYTEPMRALVNNPTMDARRLGQVIIDAYVSGYGAAGVNKVDLHLLDLSQIGQVTTALAEFDNIISNDLTISLTALATARQSAQSFGIDPSVGDNGFFSFIDLKDFMQRLYIQSLDRPNLLNAIDRLVQAVDATVAYSSADEYLPGAHGMSIYFPLNTQMYTLFGGQKGYAFASTGAQLWNELLNNIHETINNQIQASSLSVQITQAPEFGNLYDPPSIYFNYDGIGINSVKAVVLLQLNNGSEVILSTSLIARSVIAQLGQQTYEYLDFSPRDTNIYTWSPKINILTDGNQSVPILLVPRGITEALIRGVLLDQDFNIINDAVLVYNGTTQEITNVISFAENGAPFQLSPEPGTYFMPIWETLSPNGELAVELSQVAFDISRELPQVNTVAAPDGLYRIGFEIIDLAGNAVFDAANVTIVNSELDQNWQGSRLSSLGLSFLYPINWSEPSLFFREDGSVAVSMTAPDNLATQLAIVVYEGRSFDEVLAETRQRASELQNATVSDTQNLTDLPYTPSGFEYEFILDNQHMAGVRLIYNVPQNNRVYIVNLTVPIEQYDVGLEILSQFASSVTFFMPE
ncbi:MAG: hypothetical protein Kow00117_14200 [Phototrophicales bacterium]